MFEYDGTETHGWGVGQRCGGAGIVPGEPLCCEVHMQPWGHLRDGDPVPCSCGGEFATKTSRGHHIHKQWWDSEPDLHMEVRDG